MALSLAGPHAFLTFASVALAVGEEPAADPDQLIGDDTGLAVLDLMADIDALAPPGTRELNPIGLLELMAGTAEIRVNCVSPGAFPTAAEEIHEDPDAYRRHVLDHQALKRRGRPEELASVVSFLTGPDASFVTGQCVEANGGWVMA